MDRLRENTWLTKEHIINTKILPYFKDRKLIEIQACDVIAWQNELMSTKNDKGKLYEEGRIRAIGVSNFRLYHLDELAKTANTAPMVNQIRLCLGDTEDEVVDYCRAHYSWGIITKKEGPARSEALAHQDCF